MKSFKKFIEESVRPFYSAIGDFNPIDESCETLFDMTASLAKGSSYRIYISIKEDLLSAEDNIKYLRKMYPRYARNLIHCPDVTNILELAKHAYDEGYNKLIITAYAENASELKESLVKHNNTVGSHGFFNFNNGIEVKNIGSSIKKETLKEALLTEKIKEFHSGSNLNWNDSLNLYNALRSVFGLKECTYFRTHVELTKNDIREMYISNQIYNVGDRVLYKKDGQIYSIVERYTNYLKIERDGDFKKCFLTDLCEDYYKGLSKSTSNKRKAIFNKQAKMDDDNPNAYKPAPGDARAKTKASKYTKAYHAKFSDDIEENVDTALEKKSKESGISADILRKVFNRGMAAWKTGHRPGATQHQWGYARVNSFIVGGPTRKSADADLWDDHKKGLNEETWEDGYDRRVVKTTDPERKAQGFMWRIKGKEKDNLTIKYYKKKPDYEEFVSQMKRVAGHEFGK